MVLARWAILTLVSLTFVSGVLLGCGEETPRMQVERVSPPPSADIVDMVARGGEGEPRAIARSADFMWVRDGEWSATRRFDGGTFHRQANSQRDSMIWARGTWWWLELPRSASPILRRSSNGREWEEFELPGTARTPSKLADGNAVPTAYLSLETVDDAVYLVGPMRIWRLDQSGEPIWHRVDLDGVGEIENGGDFPGFIRNYLPRTEERPYELLTTFGQQLKVYRRDAPDVGWMMVSSLGTVDLDLVASPDGSAVFLAAPDGLRRSADEGETWFRFWPDEAEQLSALAMVADNTGKLGYALLAGTSSGAIYRSVDQGTSWEVARTGGPDRREISSFAVAADDITVRAASRGRGVWLSEDGGKRWTRDDGPLRGARPISVDVTSGERLVVANAGGVWEQSGRSTSGSWTQLNARRAAAVLGGTEGTVVTGTVEGAVLVQSSPDDVTEVDSLFRDGEGPDVEPRMDSALLSDRAVVILRQRPGSDTLQAWSKGNGAAYSTDGGQGWQPLPLDRSIIDALRDSLVVDVHLDGQRGIFLSTRRNDGANVLWYSPDQGLTWKAIHEMSGERARHVVLGPDDGSAIIAISADGVERSLDYGMTWRKMTGPWDGLDIVGGAHQAGRMMFLVDSRPGFEVMLVEGPAEASFETRRLSLSWPATPLTEAPLEVELTNSSVIMMGRGATWRADIPGAENPVPIAVTFIATALSILAVSAVVFFILRRV